MKKQKINSDDLIGIYFLIAAQFFVVILKLVGYIDGTWFQVFSPIIGFSLITIVFVIVGLMGMAKENTIGKKQ